MGAHGRRLVLAALTVLIPLGTAFADPLPLSPAEQDRVNQAIARGAVWLKLTQGRTGTWAPNKNHVVGYTALPGLTLLECGVPARDPAIQRAAALVRQLSPKLDTTYEISLAILFLDRLREPRDRGLIHTLALRLIAGQTSTGGWGYKCPLPNPGTARQLYLVLKELENREHFDPDWLVKKPESLDARALESRDREPKSTEPLTGVDSGGGDTRSGSASGNSGGDNSSGGMPTGIELPKDLEVPPSLAERAALPRRGTCLKSAENPPVTAGEQPKTPFKPKPLHIPANLRGLPVMLDPSLLNLRDPSGRSQQPLLATTDNSNTQFAMLALWAARRHGVPLKRTLNLLVYRFRTSQNTDGTWGYHYKVGGGSGGSPAMTCVGLLGLAIGHGTARDRDNRRSGQKIDDEQLLKGLAALARRIGQPAGRMDSVTRENLYFLWSVERVGMLFGLSTIGGKDWYRWAAEKLVANQLPTGAWDQGQYHGSSQPLDTCLALLVLKKANFTRDLTDALPFKPNKLDQVVLTELESGTRMPDPGPKTPSETPKTTPSETKPNIPRETDPPVSPSSGLPRDSVPPQPTQPLEQSPSPAAKSAESPASTEAGEERGKVGLWVALAMVLAGSGFVVCGLYLRSARRSGRGIAVRGRPSLVSPKAENL